MSIVRLSGSTSGYTELSAPAAAGNNKITLPTSNGNANRLLKNTATAGILTWSSMSEDASGNVSVSGSFSATSIVGALSTALTLSNSGNGASSGTTYNGSIARTISYNSIGAPSTTGANASGTWTINITGNAASVTNGIYTNANNPSATFGTNSSNPAGSNDAGAAATSGGLLSCCREDLPALTVGRKGTDGQLVQFYAQGNQEGNISVSGATVSYNAFMGAHWGRLPDGSKPEILDGTVLEAVNQLVEWKYVKFAVNEEEKLMAYSGPLKPGESTKVLYEGVRYTGTVQAEDTSGRAPNKHVCVKVSDTAKSPSVYGVFAGWDPDAPEGVIGSWNDINCASLGNFFIRMAKGENPEIGSLLQSAGNGCAMVQEDDIIRSSTIGKVTSSIPQKVYRDGSFLVTCVLYCG